MKAIKYIFLVMFASTVAFYSCKDDEKDACEDTKAAPKTLILKANAITKTQAGLPVAGQAVTMRIERNACGANASMNVHNFSGTTDTLGTFSSSFVSITLDNTLDEIFMTATAPDLNAIKNWSNATFFYNGVNNGDTLIVELKMTEDK